MYFKRLMLVIDACGAFVRSCMHVAKGMSWFDFCKLVSYIYHKKALSIQYIMYTYCSTWYVNTRLCKDIISLDCIAFLNLHLGMKRKGNKRKALRKQKQKLLTTWTDRILTIQPEPLCPDEYSHEMASSYTFVLFFSPSPSKRTYYWLLVSIINNNLQVNTNLLANLIVNGSWYKWPK